MAVNLFESHRPRETTITVSQGDPTQNQDYSGDFVCSGAADDVDINAALAHVNALGGGEVILLDGRYTLVDQIIVPGNSIAFSGLGEATFIDGDALENNEHAIVLSGFTDCVIRDLSIQTNDGGGLTCHCIFIEDGANRFAVINVTILDSDFDGIRIEGTNIVGGLISGCNILDVDNSCIRGVADGGNTIIGVRVEGCYLASAPINYGLLCDARCDYWTVVNNITQDCEYGLATLALSCTFTGNVLLNCTQIGIGVWGDYTSVTGNTIINPTNDGLDCNTCSFITVSGNTVFSAGNYGLYVGTLTYSALSNNTIISGARDGIYVGTSSGLSVTGNMSYLNLQHGFNLVNCDSCAFTGNTSWGNDSDDTTTYNGINLDTASMDNLFSGNYIYGNHNCGVYDEGDRNAYLGNFIHNNDKQGVYLEKTADSSLIGNFIYRNTADGASQEINLHGSAVERCKIIGNYIHGGNRSTDCILCYFAYDTVILGNVIAEATGDGIDFNASVVESFIQGNHFWSNGNAIRINAASCTDTVILWNTYFENGAILVDNGLRTVLPSYSMQFTQGTTYISAADNPWGWEIDAGGEFAITVGMIPLFVNSVVRIKVVAVGLAAPGAGNYMRLQLTGEGATFDEVYTTEPIDVATKNNNEEAFAIDDVISWTFSAGDDADIGHLRGGDRLQIKVLHEVAGNGDIATDAIVSSVEVEYC